MMQGAAYDPTFSTRKQPLGAIGAAPTAGSVGAFWRKRPGRAELGFRDEFGTAWTFDNDEGWLNRIRVYQSSVAGNNPTGEGLVITIPGSVTMPAFADTGVKARMRRTMMNTGTTAGVANGWRSSVAAQIAWFRGSAAGRGGFACSFVFGLGANVNGARAIVGVRNSNAALAGDPSALTDLIGLGFDAGDASTGNWQVMQNDSSGTATKTDSGLPRDATTLIGLQLGCDPGAAGIDVRVLNLETMSEVLRQTLTGDIPAASTQLIPYFQAHNGAINAEAGLEFVVMDGEQAIPYL